MISFEAVSFRTSGRTLFSDLTCNLNSGFCYGLVGRNGTGKTTLFKMILGHLAPETGRVSLAKDIRISSAAQEFDWNGTPLECVLASGYRRHQLETSLATLTDPQDIANAYDELIALEAHRAEADAQKILTGLGFSESRRHEPASYLSGGWQQRLALACLLFSKPDWILLDEPTNHLDFESAIWLENYISTTLAGCSLIVISHDRRFLDAICHKTLHLQAGKLKLFSGNYTTFEKSWQLQQATYKAQQESQETARSHMLSFIQRFRAGTRATQAQSRLKKLEKMELLPQLPQDPQVIFNLPSPENSLASPLIVVEDAYVGYTPSLPLLQNLNFRLDHTDRIALLGANGEGKTTLARLLCGMLTPQKGSLHKSSKLKVGYFSQHFETDTWASTPLETLRLAMPLWNLSQIRGHLARFGLGSTCAETPCHALSGGEKSRLRLAVLCLDYPHILILDEPTNHLDIDSRQALMAAINIFEGAVVLITHDEELIDSTMDQLWYLHAGRLHRFGGDLAAYRTFVLQPHSSRHHPSSPQKPKEKQKGSSQKKQSVALKRPKNKKTPG